MQISRAYSPWLRIAAVVAAVVALVALVSVGGAAPGETAPSLVPSWEGAALVIRGSGFAVDEQITLTITLDDVTRTLTLDSGPAGSFSLFTEMAVQPGQSASVEARGSTGTHASMAAVVPPGIGPREPIRLLPGGTGDAPTSVDVAGPGQAVARPAPYCPRTLACDYAERNFPPTSYRLQSLRVCGANCTTQYWVSSLADGTQLVGIDPVRGGVVLAVGTSGAADHPPVRVVAPSYAAADPACCPSSYADTTYTWDAASNALVAGDPLLTPAAEFPGWDAVRQQLQAEGWTPGGV